MEDDIKGLNSSEEHFHLRHKKFNNEVLKTK
jgi:hypothetical protein